MSAVRNYFRTALLIDDRVDADYRSPVSQQDGPNERSDEDPAPGLVPPSEQDAREGETPVRPSELIREFLRAGVVCSVLEAPDDSEGPDGLVTQVLKGAKIADLLILDWLMPRDRPLTIEAIRAVATQYPDHLTVIVVYTDVQDLSGIEQRLIDAVEFKSVEEGIVRRSNTVVLVIGKPRRVATEGEAHRRAASYCELPEMIFADLERIFRGLMPRFAFSGINALRESAPRTLAVFNAGLDAGAVIHRALLPEPADAATHFVRLLASDFEQTLHDERVGDLWHIDSLPDSLETLTFTAELGPLTQRLRSLQPSEDLAEDAREKALEELRRLKKFGGEELAREAIARGLSEFRAFGLTESSMRKAIPELTDSLDGADASNHKLAAMMDSVGFGNVAPRLELGVILLGPIASDSQLADEGAGQQMLLCVQPLCDGVRLREACAFPFVPILQGTDASEAMIRDLKGEHTGISFATNLHRLLQVQFVPSETGAVVAQGVSPNWHFTSEDRTRYRAVTRLRPDRAAQVAHALGSAATRVGTDQSEWLRLRAQS